ncbi:MAG: hypothetical protein NUK62_05465 [Tenericutes bacterium]|nr:hypothetical protein [Mycoplasmatota bacterium]
MKYIAHRGQPTQAPENTIPSFVLAAEKEHYFGIECDVYSTKDNHFVVIHNDDLKYMCKDSSKIMDLTLEEIKSFTIKAGKKIKSYPNLQIPQLSEFLDLCSKHNKAAIVEIKQVHDLTQLSDLISIFDDYPSLEIIVISFNINYLKYLRALTNRRLQYLTSSLTNEMIYDCRANQIDIGINKESVNPNLIKRLKKEGFEVAVFTVNDKKQAKQFEELGIDYITTDKL